MTMSEGILEIDAGDNRVRLGSQSVTLPRLSFNLLVELAQAAPAPLSNADIRSRVWKDVHVSNDTVKQRIKLLRAALDEGGIGREWIKTAPGQGYCLNGPVRIAKTSEFAQNQHTPKARSGFSRKIFEKFGLLPISARGLALSAMLVLVSISAAFFFAQSKNPVSENTNDIRLAVLAFTEINEHENESPVGVGLREELTGFLSRHQGIVSVAASSSRAASDLPIPEIGKALDVAAVIEGNVRSDGEQRRFSVRLVSTETEELTWSGEYSLPASAGLRDWARIVLHISKNVYLELESEMAPSRPGGTTNTEAYQAYLSGVDLLKKPSGIEAYEIAAQNFEKAIDLDPAFALARARLAECLARLALADDAGANYATRALQQSQRALEMNPDLPEANFAHGLALLASGQGDLAKPLLDRARRQRPYLALELDRMKVASQQALRR